MPSKWRVNLCDLYGNTISNLTPIAEEKKYVEAWNAPKTFSFTVDPADDRVSGFHVDGAPMLDYIRRTVKAYRWEELLDGTYGYVLRFRGYVWPIQDNGEPDGQMTAVTCYDPLIITTRRLARDAAGSFSLVRFTDTDAAQVLKTVIDRTNTFAGHTGVVTTGGSFPAISNISVEWSAKKINEIVSELTAGMDIDLVPLDTSDTREMARLDVFKSRGQKRDAAIFGWHDPPHNLGSITRIMDPNDAVNVLLGLGGTTEAGQLTTVAVDNASISQFLQLEDVATYSDVTDQAYLNSLVANDLYSRRPPAETIEISEPQPGYSPEPWKDFNAGDTVTVNASPKLRGGVLDAEKRIYGFGLSVNENDDETLELATAREDQQS